MPSGIYKRTKPVWNKGRPCPDDTKLKIRKSKLGSSAPWMIGNQNIKGDRNPNYRKFGKNHPCWKENKSRPFHNAIRQLFKYRQWRSDIFTRDNFTCVLCGTTGYVEADHYPKRFVSILKQENITTIQDAIVCEPLWDINNGRTLCKPCHDPTRGRRKLTNL